MLLPLALLTCGCSSAAGQPSVDVSCDEFSKSTSISKQATAAVGDTLLLTLCSNPSTGFSWEDPVISDKTVIEQTGHQVQPAGSDKVGSPGKESWTIKVLKRGSVGVSTAYSRPWQGGEKGVWTFRLELEVR